MKAIRLLEYGGELVFNDVPMPTIACDEMLVKIRSTAVNHLDLVEASGTARQILPIDLPDAAQGWKDIAGNLPGVHGMSPSGPGGARHKSHGKIVIRVA